MKKKSIIVVQGPTASGKTSLAIKLANHLDTVILSSDSRQFYREMEIGTAKPTLEELAAAPHYFINNKSIHDVYTAGMYEFEGLALLEELFKTRDTVIVAGGSGLYIKGLCEGFHQFPTISDETKAAVDEMELEGLESLQDFVRSRDPKLYSTIDTQNSRRLYRASSVILESGLPYTSFLREEKSKRPFDVHYYTIGWERAALYDRINRRVELMIEAGLEEEVIRLMPHKDLTPLKTVGYQEWFPYFDGEYDKNRVIELIQQNSRRYAKRQVTWFKRTEKQTVIGHDDVASILRSF